MSDLDPVALREAFGRFMTGVTVVTTRDAAGQTLGFTANSFASVSLQPPLLLVCPSRSLSSFDAFAACEHFAVNVLAERQRRVSNTFASGKGDRFAAVDWQPDAAGCPLLAGAAAQFSCRSRQVVPAGDHVILVGEVTDFSCTGLRGLGFAAGQYFSLGLEHDAQEGVVDARRAYAGVIIEYDGRVLLCGTDDKLHPPRLPIDHAARIRSTLRGWLADKGFDTMLGNAYSIFDDRDGRDHFTYFRAEAANDSTRDLGRYYRIDELAGLEYESAAHASMLKRYAFEYQTRSFGLYLGDEHAGDLLSYGNGSKK